MIHIQTGNMLDVIVEGKSIGLQQRGRNDVIWLPQPEGLRDVLTAEIQRLSGKAAPKQFVWVVTGHSESGDDVGPEVYDNKPSKKLLKKLAFDWDGTDEADGPGDYGSYVHLTVSKVEVQK